ncbi:Meiosis arrest female protein [Trema orientale]|uniref:Meiosis arrest female protein n=1 Tax=Trema orientale TaxID=63057 RepID=A0A2P5ED71_TREOI|nr:Meiosis arrest female protein [Trema orientale]
MPISRSSAMKVLSPKIHSLLFSSSSSSSSSSTHLLLLLLQVSHFSTSPPHSSRSPYSSPRRHDDEGFRNVGVSVWWNFESCGLPAAINVFKVSHAITSAVRANGIKGPVQITAFGDVLQLRRAYQEALSSTGINLTHIPSCGKNSADKSLLLDLMCWVSHNPPPAHLFLISGDNDLASVLCRLRMQNYNILLASTENASEILCNAATVKWDWHDLLRGGNLTGKHFNQPPDGPYGSWYGLKKVPLLDPFLDVKQSSSSNFNESSTPSSAHKLCPIPKAVAKHIKKILDSHPKGLSLAELRFKLSKSNITIDREFYGYKKFTRFILAMPHILRLQQAGDGYFLVHSITTKSHKPIKCNQDMPSVPVGDSEECPNLPSELNANDKSVNENRKLLLPTSPEKLPIHSSPDLTMKKTSEKSEHLLDEKTVKMVNAADLDPNEVPQDSKHQLSLFKKVWRKWFGSSNGGQENCCSSDDGAESRSHTVPEKHFTNNGSFARGKEAEIHLESATDTTGLPPSSSSHNNLVLDNETSTYSEAHKMKGHSRDNSNLIVNPGEHELFSKDSFSSGVKSFMATSKGSRLVSESRTREQMARNFQKEEPSKLTSLSENDLLHLRDSPVPTDSSVSSGLRSTFSDISSQSDKQISPENDGGENSQSTQPAEFSPTDTNKNLRERSRTEILADCEKLVKKIRKKHPEGCNMSVFSERFLESYGYELKLPALGYKRLKPLLELMPGVKAGSEYMIPSDKAPKIVNLENTVTDQPENDNGTVANSSGELSGSSRKDNNSDLVCKVMGPKNDGGSVEPMDSDHQPSLSGDAERETPPLTEPSGQQTAKVGIGEDRHLQMVADSLYTSKHRYQNKDKSVNVAGMNGGSTQLSGLFNVDAKIESCLGKLGRKKSLLKSSSLVSKPVINDKDKLIDGILGSLRKSSESSSTT